MRRVAFAAVLAGIVGAGQWLLVKADVPQVGANNWASAGDFGAMPEGSAAASLADGRIVVAGGHYSDGTLVSQVGIYNPVSQSWANGGQLGVARTGHTVTALDDGRVLIAGGRTVNGPSFDVEIYNPNTGQSVHAGDLWVPRVNHAAVELGSGLVLVAGGSNGSGVLDYLELFDSTSGVTQSLSIRLAVAREKLTATRLLDGHVLLAGGRDGSGSLAIAEIFSSGSRSIFETGSLRTARSGHTAVLLPNNNQVLIAGGTVNGAPTASAELYADWRNGFRAVPNPMSQARTAAAGGALPYHNLAFVGGGGATSGEYFGYATVKTDKADYWPGETVTITGSGWQPGETVTLKISEDADTHNDFTYTAVADAQGNIINTQFAPIENDVFHHFGMRFYLTATGVASTALNTFTDGNSTITGTVRDSATNAAIPNATVSCAGGCNEPASTTTNAAGSYSFKVPFDGSGTATITLSAVAGGYASQTLPSFLTEHQQTINNKNFFLVANVRPTSTSVSCEPAAVAVNATTSCTATVSDTGAAPATVPAGTVAFSTGGAGNFVPLFCTLSGTPATCSVGYTPSARGDGSHEITGTYTPTSSHTGSTSPQFNLAVTKANQAALNLTTPASIVFGATGTATATGGTGNGAVTFSAGSSTGCSIDATSGVITVTNASGTCLISAEKAGDDNLLAVTAGPNSVTLEKADAVVTVTGVTVIYDGDEHGASGTAKGVNDADLSAQLDLGAKFINVPGGTANWTFNGGDNYVTENGSVQIVINQADATIGVKPYAVTYDAAPHTATGIATGVKGEDLSNLLNLSGTTHTDAGTYTNDPWTFAGNVNYKMASGVVTNSIARATPTIAITWVNSVYNTNPHPASAVVTGVAGQTNLAPAANLVYYAGASVGGTPLSGAPVNAGTYTVQAVFAGNTNYTDTTDQKTITIEKAPPTIVITWLNSTYNTDPNPATVAVDGVGGEENLSPAATFAYYAGGDASGTPLGTAPVNAGTYTVKADFAGNDNYKDATATKTITIQRATPTVIITWANSTYNTNPNPASAVVNGVGGELNLSPAATLVYYLGLTASGAPLAGAPVDAGTYTVRASFEGNTNYKDVFADQTITIHKADQAITFGPLANKTFGDPPFSVTATGGASGEPVTFSSTTGSVCSVSPNVNPATVTILAVGLCTVQASQKGNKNYNDAPPIDRSFSIAAWTANGFHQPVGIPNSIFAPAPNAYAALLFAPPPGAAWNSARGGQTIPLKFNVFAAGVELTSIADIAGFVARQLSSCSGTGTEDIVEFETAGSTALRYEGVAGSGGQFIQNWKTPAVRGEQCFRVELTFRDQSILYTFVKLKK